MEQKHKAKMTNYDFLTKNNISLHWELELVMSLISILSMSVWSPSSDQVQLKY